MAQRDVSEPLPISKVAGRFLLFDIDVVTYLRRTHNICGVLIGSIPQMPQQNVFQGLPVELLPEEVRLLVEKGVVYVVDDLAYHKNRFENLQGANRAEYLDSLRSQGLRASKATEAESRLRSERAIAKQAGLKGKKRSAKVADLEQSVAPSSAENAENALEVSLFDGDVVPQAPVQSTTPSTSTPFAVTPTTTYTAADSHLMALKQLDICSSPSYPLFASLHAKGYYMTPGLRFGCDYTVYPGDPLRFHSHFLAVGYDWNKPIPLLDLVGGGRLGTGVKKGFLIGGENADSEEEEKPVRSFCIEWGGM